MIFKAIIFDLDGTLVDSINGIAFSANEVLGNHNLPVHTVDTYKTFVGNGLRELVRKAIPQSMINDNLVETLHKELKDSYVNHWDYKMCIYDGIESLLDTLNENGIKLAVNTNKDTSFTSSIMVRLFSKWNFNCVIGGTSLKTLKPDPEGALLIAKTLNVQPEECVYMGDSEVDIQTANNAGMHSVSASWGFRTKEDLIYAGAKRIIKYPLELLGILN